MTEVKRLAPRTVRECHRISSVILREAVDSQLIAASPCHKITLPRVEKRERRFLSAEEVERLADSIDPRYRAVRLLRGLTEFAVGRARWPQAVEC
jgi:integrase